MVISSEGYFIEPQPRFSNIMAFDNEFYITSSGKAMLTSIIDSILK